MRHGGLGGADGGGSLDGERLTGATESLLRPALEAAMGVARAGEEATPIEPSPPALRPFLQFARLPRPALVATRRVLDGDEDFRARVVGSVTESDVGRSGWLYLSRPEGWEDELAKLVAEAQDRGEEEAGRRAELDARKRLAGAEAARRRAEEAALAAEAEAARAANALSEERRARRAATEDVARLERRLKQVTVERDRAREAAERAGAEAEEGGRLVAELRFALEHIQLPEPPPVPQLRTGPGPGGDGGDGGEDHLPSAAEGAPAAETAAGVPGDAVVPALPPPLARDVAGAARALDHAAEAAGHLARALSEVAASLRGDPAPAGTDPVDPAGPAGPEQRHGSPAPADHASTRAPTGARGGPAGAGAGPAGDRPPAARASAHQVLQPVPLPPGIFDDSHEAAEHLVRVPGVALLVDGYNVSQLGWPEAPISEQRRRLVDALAELSARTSADVAVVFDGADAALPPVVPVAARPVRVMFSPPGVEADDVVMERAAELRPFRPVVVASSDRRVQAGAGRAGANVISSSQLLAVLRR